MNETRGRDRQKESEKRYHGWWDGEKQSCGCSFILSLENENDMQSKATATEIQTLAHRDTCLLSFSLSSVSPGGQTVERVKRERMKQKRQTAS